MTECRARTVRRLALVSMAVLVLPATLFASQTTVTVSGLEQGGSGAPWDAGSLTVTINGHSETVAFGQFSSVQSVASGLAAKFSLDCQSPVQAMAQGAVITFSTKKPDEVFFETSSAPVWDSSAFLHSSFDLAHGSSAATGITPSLTLSCSPNPIPAGAAVDCTAELPAGATGTVAFTIDTQPSWSTAAVDGGGWAPAAALSGLQTGSHTLHAAYSGDSHYKSTTQEISLPVLSGSLAAGTVYSYSITQPGGSTTGYAPNGNILAYTDSVNGEWNFQYDGLNRLTAGNDLPVAATAEQYMCWTYDSFGNRTVEATSASAFAGGVCPSSGQGVSPAQYNQSNQITGNVLVTYDAAGNVLTDGANTYAYDGDRRVCAVATRPISGGLVLYQYIYDADGNRVAKGTIQPVMVNGQPTVSCNMSQNQFTPTNSYVLGPGDEQVSEMTITAGQPSWAHTNVYSGGMLLATYDPQGLHFQIGDWLGSRRVQTNAFGQVEENCPNLPYGNGLNCSFPAGAPSTADDATEHHFTGKERDAESGLDYFGARYYASNMGRWMSPDWAANPEAVPYSHLDNPQSLNLYGYVLNNPLYKPDLDGHGCPPDCGDPTMATQVAPPSFLQTAKDFFSLPFTNDYSAGGMKIGVGIGLIGTTAFGDVPGGVAGALLVTNATLGGVGSAVSGTTQILGKATGTDTTEAREAVSAVTTVPGLVTAAGTGGNLKAAGAVSTLTNAATLGAKPTEAFKNPATMADAAQTTKETTSLFRSAVNVVKSFFVPPPPPPQQQH